MGLTQFLQGPNAIISLKLLRNSFESLENKKEWLIEPIFLSEYDIPNFEQFFNKEIEENDELKINDLVETIALPVSETVELNDTISKILSAHHGLKSHLE